MSSFAIIAEGVTDQAVLENILKGYFEKEKASVTYVQPRRDATSKSRDPAPGGWTLVFQALKDGRHEEALAFNDYVIVHLDTDVSEEAGYEVPSRAAGGRMLSPEELIENVKLKLIAEMDPEFYKLHADRIVFAIAVDAIECWLLPLLYEGEPKKKAKITGCLEAVDLKLRRLNQPPLSTAGSKSLARYEKVSQAYAKRRMLEERCRENPSLYVFVKSLTALGGTSTGDAGNGAEPGAVPVRGAPEG
jgi:hypothetical protein